MSWQRLHVDGLEEAGARQVRQPSRIVAVGLVGRQRLEHLVGLPALDADHGEAGSAEPKEEDRRHASGLNTIRRQLGALASSLATAGAVDSVLLSRTTTPSRSRTRTWVSSIEMSRPAKSFHWTISSSGRRQFLSAHVEELPPDYPMLKNWEYSTSITIQETAGVFDEKFLRGAGGPTGFAVCDAPICPAVRTIGLTRRPRKRDFSGGSISEFFNTIARYLTLS